MLQQPPENDDRLLGDSCLFALMVAAGLMLFLSALLYFALWVMGG